MTGVLDVARATEALSATAAFGPIVEEVGPVALGEPRATHFGSLVRSIVFQQLAGRAAATIHERVVDVLDGEVSPQRVAAADDAHLRGAGLSAAKLAAIRDLTDHVVDGRLDLERVAGLPDDDVVAVLSAVRGIGRWTAEMFLMFQLHRPDVWPVTDLGVRRGFALAHHMTETPQPAELVRLGEPYRPWRTAAAWYCWRAVEVVTPG